MATGSKSIIFEDCKQIGEDRFGISEENIRFVNGQTNKIQVKR